MPNTAVLSRAGTELPTAAQVGAGESVRILACKEMLFRSGERKASLYRVEAGAVCVFAEHVDGPVETVELAVPGDMVGQGFLDHHAFSAQAMVDTRVARLPLDAADRIDPSDTRAAARYKAAIEREFNSRRVKMLASGHGRPAVRLAALLLVLSGRNKDEGRDPALIDDGLDEEAWCRHLGLGVDVLALGIVELERRGLIRATRRSRFRLRDLQALQAFADEAPRPVAAANRAAALRGSRRPKP